MSKTEKYEINSEISGFRYFNFGDLDLPEGWISILGFRIFIFISLCSL